MGENRKRPRMYKQKGEKNKHLIEIKVTLVPDEEDKKVRKEETTIGQAQVIKYPRGWVRSWIRGYQVEKRRSRPGSATREFLGGETIGGGFWEGSTEYPRLLGCSGQGRGMHGGIRESRWRHWAGRGKKDLAMRLERKNKGFLLRREKRCAGQWTDQS